MPHNIYLSIWPFWPTQLQTVPWNSSPTAITKATTTQSSAKGKWITCCCVMDIDNKKNPFAALSYPQDGHFGNLFGGFLLLFRTRTQKTTTGLVVLAIETGACNHQLINLRCTGARYNSSLRVEAGAGKKESRVVFIGRALKLSAWKRRFLLPCPTLLHCCCCCNCYLCQRTPPGDMAFRLCPISRAVINL